MSKAEKRTHFGINQFNMPVIQRGVCIFDTTFEHKALCVIVESLFFVTQTISSGLI